MSKPGAVPDARGDEGWRYGVETGWYRNSQARISQYVVATADRPVLWLREDTQLRLGVIAGLANYHGGAEGFGNKGIPTIGDWLLVGGATVGLRREGAGELRMGIHPAPEIADVLLTFQVRLDL